MAREREADDGAPAWVRSFLRVGPSVALAATVAAIILTVVFVLAAVGKYKFSYYSLDPARTLGGSPLVGLMSHAGVLLMWGGATICVFSGLLVAHARGWREASPLLLVGLGVGYLTLDDLFVLHEDLYPNKLGVPERAVFAAYAVIALGFLLIYRDFFRRHEPRLLLLGAGLLVATVAIDLKARDLLVYENLKRWAEDGVKIFGIAFFVLYLVRLSVRMLVETYPLASTRDAVAGDGPRPADRRTTSAATTVE